MPETTPSRRLAEAYFPISPAPSATEPVPNNRTAPMGRASSALIEASRLLLDGQQLLQESRAVEAERLFLQALALYEREGSMSAECVPVFIDLAAIATTRGDLVTAESYLQRALALANVRFGADHPDVATILGGLARLYLHRSEFTKAEPLLQQLLEIKRARGQDHPEVATVLASLATVHSAMGAHESAEGILRRALAIRERTLAPNHFATVTTLEHLAESCTALGKFEEARSLLHRALAHRQRALGVSHPSIATARTRIADLELLASNEELGSVPTVTPLMSALAESYARPDEALDSGPTLQQEAVDVTEPPRPAAYSELFDEWEDEVEEPRDEPPMLNRLEDKVASVTAFARTPRGHRTLLTIGLTSLFGAVVLAAQMRDDVALVGAEASSISSQSGSFTRPSANVDAAPQAEFSAQQAPVTSTRLTRSDTLPHPSTATTASLQRSERSDALDTAISNDSQPIALPVAPNVRTFEAPVDAALIAPARAPLVASTDFTQSRASLTERATAGARGRSVHPILPADNPAPEYPPDLMRQRIEGRVVAEFLVDAKGRVDTRTVRIISSTDEPFTQAVRAVLPSLRFLPAEIDGVKTESWVAMPFRFSPKQE